MASLNLSIEGPSIKSSYLSVINGPAPSGSSPTAASWALFTVKAPLLNAFQDSGAKESILKVHSTGHGELADLFEDFSEGHVQFAFVKVKDPNTGLPKHVLIAWCGGGVPERTKGYFTSHLNAVSKVLHGYHVQITARSDSDLEPDSLMRKVADASGAKYSAPSASESRAAAPPPVAKKPVFTPTASSASRSGFNPLVAARSRNTGNEDNDGWGDDAPPVTRTKLEKVESAYKPTKVNMAELVKQKQQPSQFTPSAPQRESSDIVKGGYQPVGKVDIAAIRAAAKEKTDDRPTPVKGAYEPVGKVDIAAIRAKARKPEPEEDQPRPASLAERSTAFSQPSESERLTSLPKPKVAKKFGGAAFSGTRPPAPSGFGLGTSAAASSAPVAGASRTFADQGGKTPAQLWAEKKAREGSGPVSPVPDPAASPIASQKSGSEWKSGYTGKSWAVKQPGYSKDASNVDAHATGDSGTGPASIPSIKDRFTEAPPIPGVAQERSIPAHEESTAPPPLPESTRPPSVFALPGLPSRPAEPEEEPEPTPPEPPRPDPYEREESPPRVAIPVARSAPEPEPEPEPEPPAPAARPVPPPVISEPEPEPEPVPAAQQPTASESRQRAIVQYDYEKAEDNEIELREGELVTNINMVDADWWMGTNPQGEVGLFPSNYVELVEDDYGAGAGSVAAPPPPPAVADPTPAPPPSTAPAATAGPTATALYDYEAAEDNELSFPEGAKITGLEFPDEDWWFGQYNGQAGLFPANYVERD